MQLLEGWLVCDRYGSQVFLRGVNMWGLRSVLKAGRSRTFGCFFRLALACGTASCLTMVAAAQTFSASKTAEGIQRKAVITAAKGKLFGAASGSSGTDVGLMDVFFILEGGGPGKRTPVARAPDKGNPDGWLENDSFAEWNTLQMVDFAPQGGREIAQVFDTSKCAIDFSRSGKTSICQAMGHEPDRQGQTPSFKILVPVFKSEAESSSVAYEGGFVRVTPGQVVAAADPSKIATSEARAPKKSGFELVLAIDSTISMQSYFRPTLDAVTDFVGQVEADLKRGEVREAIRIGLLFYQDRKIGTECTLDYITQWRVPLTENAGAETVDAVKSALATEHEARCGSDEPEEAVFDAVNRALLDPVWKDGSFRIVAVIGDADPHWDTSYANYEKKNPLHLTTKGLLEMADQKNVRLLTNRIVAPTEGATQFEPLALQRGENLKGRFNRIPADPAQVRQALTAALWKEWSEIVEPARKLEEAGATQANVKNVLAKQNMKISDFAYPIIVNMLPAASAGSDSQSFSRGWVPQKILDKSAVNEFVFMRSLGIQDLSSLIDLLVRHMEEGQSGGPEAFIDALRSSLATQLKLRPEEVFAPGEPLASLLHKAKILPFETGVLRFTREEIDQWRKEDYDRVIKILKERNTSLKEYTQVAGNIRQFGDVKYFYVPQNLFP
jgi:hypothetical protein